MSKLKDLYQESEEQVYMRKKKPPRFFDEIDFRQVKELAEAGFTERQIALEIGVSQSTLTAWKKRHPEFKDLLKVWKLDADEQVERSLFERATGYVHSEEKVHIDKEGRVTRIEVDKHYPPDVKAIIFWLKNRRRDEWRDKQEVEHSGNADFAQAIIAARRRAGLDTKEQMEKDAKLAGIEELLR